MDLRFHTSAPVKEPATPPPFLWCPPPPPGSLSATLLQLFKVELRLREGVEEGAMGAHLLSPNSPAAHMQIIPPPPCQMSLPEALANMYANS